MDGGGLTLLAEPRDDRAAAMHDVDGTGPAARLLQLVGGLRLLPEADVVPAVRTS
jgi:hypothetical protein